MSQDRVPQQFQQDDVYTFHSRQFSPEDAREKFEEIKVRRDEVFEELIRKYGLKLGFYDERTQPFDDEPLASSHATSYCKTDATDINKHHIFVLLNTNLIEPLLLFDSELTDCERMGHHFFTALTLVHELMVGAVFFIMVHKSPERRLLRCYYSKLYSLQVSKMIVNTVFANGTTTGSHILKTSSFVKWDFPWRRRYGFNQLLVSSLSGLCSREPGIWRTYVVNAIDHAAARATSSFWTLAQVGLAQLGRAQPPYTRLPCFESRYPTRVLCEDPC